MFDAFFDFIANALAFFYDITGDSYGGAIILLTLAINVALLPLTLKGTRSMMQMQRLQPEMKALQAKYKDDRETLNREMMAFYKENNINPVGGCLPLLLQLPVFLVLYQVIRGLTRTTPEDGSIPGCTPDNFCPKYLEDSSSALATNLEHTDHMNWLGIDLSESAQHVFRNDGLLDALPYLVLILIVLVTSYIQQKQVSSRNADAQTNAQQKMLLRIMPAFFALISWSLPAALTLYFATANIFRVGQQEFISRTMYKEQRAKAKAARAEAKANGGKTIDAKSKPKGPVTDGPGAGGLLGRLLGQGDQNGDAGADEDASTSKSVTESKGRPTPKRDGTLPSSKGGKAKGSKAKGSGSSKGSSPSKPKKKPSSSGRATPAGSLPQPRPRKKKRK